jgi:hypothetical protein
MKVLNSLIQTNVTVVVAGKVLESEETYMKKLVAILLLSLSATTAMAYGHGGYYRSGWVGPAIVGGVIGYGLARPYYYPPVYVQPPVVYTQPPVYYQQPPVYYQQPTQPQSCQRVITQNEQGQVIREETRCN